MAEPCFPFCFVVCSNCLFPISLSLPQLGNCTDRNACHANKSPMLERMKEQVKLKKEVVGPYLQACFQEMEAIVVKRTPAMVGGKVLKELKTADSWKSSFHLASNLLNTGTSALANHVDAKSVLPAAMTCCNPMRAARPWFHGELLCTQGAFLVHHTLGDVALMFGDSCHAVLPIAPTQSTRNPVHFSVIQSSRWGWWKRKKERR
jgi:hypothetical protein